MNNIAIQERQNYSKLEFLKLKEENEKLEKQLTDMFNLMSMLNELTLSFDLNEVYRNILDILVVSIGSRRHSIALIDNAGVLKIVASKFGDDEVNFEHAILEKGTVKQVLKTRKMFVADDFVVNNKDGKNSDDVIACIPLLVKDAITGVIIIYELLSHKRRFTEDDRELFNLISSHAGYSFLAAQAYEKSKKDVENRDKEITRLNDISSLVNSTDDIGEVLHIILDAIADLLICDIIAIMLYDEGENSLLLRHSMGLPPELLKNYSLKIGEGISGRVFKEKKPILIKDMNCEVRYSDLLLTREAGLYSGSILSVPIMIKNKSIGVITVSKFKGGNFLDVPEKKILTNLAAQAAVGIDNAYLHEMQENELVRVSNLFIATNQLHSTLDLDEIYKISKEILIDFIGAKTFSVMLKDQSEKELSIVLSRGIDRDIVDNVRIPIGEGLIGQSVEDGKSFIISKNQSPPVVRLYNKDFKLFACIPLKLENKIVGVICINELLAQKNDFVKFDRDLFDLMAQHTAAAILRAQMFAKSEQKTSSMYDLSRLLRIEYDLKKSLNIVLKLVHNNLKDTIKSAVFFNAGDNKYNVLAYRGYTADEVEKLSLDNGQRSAAFLPLYCDKKQVGALIVENASDRRFTQKELDILNVAGNLISQFIYHDRNFKLSKNLAIMLEKEKKQSRAIVKGVADGLLVTDVNSRIMLVNPIVERLFNFRERDAVGADIEKFIFNKKIKKMLRDTLEKGHAEEKIEMKVSNNSVTFDTKSSMVIDEKKKPVGIVSIMHDITKETEADRIRAQFLKKLKKISITDPLTNIYNRRYFDSRLKHEFDRSRRYGRNMSCIMIDVDHFKMINDTYGHDVGDKALKYIADIIRNGIRDVELVARYGGEEFVIILPETSADSASIVGERLRKTIENGSFLVEGHNLELTISLGVSSYPSKEIESSQDIVKLADKALYKAKKGGRNRMEVFKS